MELKKYAGVENVSTSTTILLGTVIGTSEIGMIVGMIGTEIVNENVNEIVIEEIVIGEIAIGETVTGEIATEKGSVIVVTGFETGTATESETAMSESATATVTRIANVTVFVAVTVTGLSETIRNTLIIVITVMSDNMKGRGSQVAVGTVIRMTENATIVAGAKKRGAAQVKVGAGARRRLAPSDLDRTASLTSQPTLIWMKLWKKGEARMLCTPSSRNGLTLRRKVGRRLVANHFTAMSSSLLALGLGAAVMVVVEEAWMLRLVVAFKSHKGIVWSRRESVRHRHSGSLHSAVLKQCVIANSQRGVVRRLSKVEVLQRFHKLCPCGLLQKKAGNFKQDLPLVLPLVLLPQLH